MSLGMRCAACGYAQMGEFPSTILATGATKAFKQIALECVPLETEDAANNIVVFYACPKCGTLRIRIRELTR